MLPGLVQGWIFFRVSIYGYIPSPVPVPIFADRADLDADPTG
jgi:hypothetical protein